MGKVVRLLKGKDDIVRAVELKTHNKAGKIIIIKRPIQCLYPLEIPQGIQETSVEHSVQEHNNEEPNITLVRDKDVLQHIV